MNRTGSFFPFGIAVALVLSAGSFFPARGDIEVAEELLVDLTAEDPTAGDDEWTNNGSLANFKRLGEPQVEDVDGVTAVVFRGLTVGPEPDSYQCLENAPDGLIGVDPTRSIEVWVFNESIGEEETLVAWGKRGGPNGTNMSFNYGTNAQWGAVGHWGAAGHDLGWNDAGGAPEAGKWHHLVYTYDGTTTRVYADGELANFEELGPGVINTYGGTPITVAAQIEPDGVTLNVPLAGTLAIGRVRVHDGVLTPEQVKNNFNEERAAFGVTDEPPVITGPPGEDVYAEGDPVYVEPFYVSGLPTPVVEAVSPAGATIVQFSKNAYTVRYEIPDPEPDSFTVTVRASSAAGTDEVSWTVTKRSLPAAGELAVAGELFVNLDASDPSAGEDPWENKGTLGDFTLIGAPVVEEIDGVTAVNFNSDPLAPGDAYQCLDVAPDGLVGLDPTRTVEVWVYNPEIPVEDTILSWGKRGGPCGTNMSFNYGSNEYFGAVGHWCHLPGPDIGWGPVVPAASQWHYLVYTYDGTTTRVYADGALANQEELGPGAVNTHPGTAIVLAAQYEADGIGFTMQLMGTLALARVRIHDGALSPLEILHNFNLERGEFGIVDEAPAFNGVPDSDEYASGDESYSVSFTVTGVPAPTVELLSPAGAVLDALGGGAWSVTYQIPSPAPQSFVVSLRARNSAGTADASWTVARRGLPPEGELAIAGELFVNLDASDPTAGEDTWENKGTLGDFVRVGDPVREEVAGITAVTFNRGVLGDAYQCVDNAPDGLVGKDPTRTIEVWAFNPDIAVEETLVAWGKRGGPNGTNMSFNYGTDGRWGAVGHWGGDGPDLGWNDAGGAPTAGQWHHLVYTYDGTTSRVYADGELANSEVLGSEVINTYGETPITIAAQIEPDGQTLNTQLMGTLSLARIRVHDGVLTDAEVAHNFKEELKIFASPPEFTNAPEKDFFYEGAIEYTYALAVTGLPVPALEVIEPPEGTITEGGLFSYPIPPGTESFQVTIKAVNSSGSAEATWTVEKVRPVNIRECPVHRYSFESDVSDSLGDADGIAYGAVAFEGGAAVLNNDGSQYSNTNDPFPDEINPDKDPPGAYIDLPNGIISDLGEQMTIETWVTWSGPATSNWQRIFDFGTSDAGENNSTSGMNTTNIFLTPRSGFGTLRLGYRKGDIATERWLDQPILGQDTEQHLVVVWNDDTSTVQLFVNGVLMAEDGSKHVTLAELIDDNNWLGRSQWPDPLFSGAYNEFRIYDYALTPSEVLGNFESGPEVLTCMTQEEVFQRGDANSDGGVNIADAIFTLGFLFAGGEEPLCRDAADANDDGGVNIADAIAILGHLFGGAGDLPAPFKTCGPDPTDDTLPECRYPPEKCP